MIEYKSGSLFDSTAQCLVNPVNCVGVMGKGLALEFKHRYPGMLPFYRKYCDSGDLRFGTVGFWIDMQSKEQVVCLFPTKTEWRQPSTIALVDASFRAFVKYAPKMSIGSAAFPKVGCGLGGLDFDRQIRPLFERHFAESPIHIEVYV